MHPFKLRERLLASPAPLLLPGVFDPFSALLAEQAGFEGVYLSGAAIAYTQFALPDIGLISMAEVANVLTRIRERVTLPIVVDCDTGFGNALNVQRTVRMFERAGGTVLQFEDQSFPKRCGHLRDKKLVSCTEMVGKIHAAVDVRDQALIIARTDAIAVDGFDRAMDRAEAYLAAGADILFIEAPENIAQMQAITARFAARVPLLANMVEGGSTPIRSAEQLGELGFRLVIFPGGTVRAMARGLADYFTSLRHHGTTAPFADKMLDLTGLNAVLGTPEILAGASKYEAKD